MSWTQDGVQNLQQIGGLSESDEYLNSGHESISSILIRTALLMP